MPLWGEFNRGSSNSFESDSASNKSMDDWLNMPKRGICNLCCVLHALRRHQRTLRDDEGCSKLNICVAFCTHWDNVREPQWVPRYATNSTSVLHFASIEVIPVPWSMPNRYTVCVTFCTHWDDVGVPRLMPRDAINSMLVLCFICFQAIPRSLKKAEGCH